MHGEARDLSEVGEQWLSALARVSPDLLCAIDRDGSFRAVNPAWHRLLGWSAEDLVGRPFGDFLSESDRRRTWSLWESDVLAGRTVGDFENRWPTRDGGHRFISWSAALDAETGLVFCSGRDITGRVETFVRVAHDARLLSAAEQAAGIGVWEWEVAHDSAYLSDGLHQIFGTDPSEPFSFAQLLEMAVPEDREALERDVGDALAHGTSFSTEYRLRRPDGREVVVWERGESVVDEGRTVRMFGTVKDITAQRATEAELRRAAALEQEAAERLRGLDELKNAFLSAVSHELRTPLAVVQGMANTLQRLRGRLPTGRRDQIEDALADHAERMQRLLDDLLDVDRLARGTLYAEPEYVDAVDVVRRAIASSDHRALVSLDAPEHLQVCADPVQLDRILVNLLTNAAKYAPGAEVSVSVERFGAEGCRLEVSDSGPGVAADDLNQLVQPFYRADDQHPSPGTGVGLALVAEFAQLHGGRAWVEHNVPSGLRVVVELAGIGIGGDGHAHLTPSG
ncbi:ATP-binding protein [Egicoccus sp. AB-alg6-2]|uniref:sensor histidine kinase n=1 Tax=Egicoccus sp. AB-alg6-2 TaxID=3242692 RepID=UPI00359CDE38